jgi:5-methyltetrahydropteroyltriglutamate--homocysteine methyltransferase
MAQAGVHRPHDEEFLAMLAHAVRDVVAYQTRIGVDVVCDGEFGRPSWNNYLHTRLAGHEPVRAADSRVARSRDRARFAGFYAEMDQRGERYYANPGGDLPEGYEWACTGPVTYIGHERLREDLENLRAAVAASTPVEGFVTSTSPIRPGHNRYYSRDEDYYAAIGEAMRTEYQAIVDAGFVVQIDDPHLPDMWDNLRADMRVDAHDVNAYLAIAERHVEIINHALRGIPSRSVRYHICWGSWHGPHSTDIELKDLVHVLNKVRAGCFVVEAANPRHEHEWQVWGDTPLPAEKVIAAGVISHATNTVEHPDLVSLRIQNFASVVGRERVIASTDCGLGYRVHPEIATAKLETLVEGARRASDALWR